MGQEDDQRKIQQDQDQPLHIWNDEEPQPIAVPLLGHYAQDNAKLDQRNYNFVGRESIIKELLTILNETRLTKGCYLISGFRGSGKTTLINKVLALYGRGETSQTWLPTVPTIKANKLSRGFKDVLNRGRSKLETSSNISKVKSAFRKWLNINLIWCWRIPSTAKSAWNRIYRPLITIRVNLGQDQSLDPREVLFNTATILYKQLLDKQKRVELILGAIIAFIATLLAITYLGEWFNNWINALLLHPKLPDWLDWLRLPAPIQGQSNSVLFFGFVITSAVYYLWTRHLPTNARVLYLLQRLNKRMVYSIEQTRGVQQQGFLFSRKETMPPLDARQIENEMLDILKQSRKVPRFFRKLDIVFIFDELDKIAHHPSVNDDKMARKASVGRDLHECKRKVDTLLGALKNFITHGHARFFFIAGHEMLDSYHAERGSTSSLYESLFNRVFEVTSLLTDASDHNRQRIHSLTEVYVCRKLMDPDMAIYLWLQRTYSHRENDPYWQEDLNRKLMYSPFCLRTYYHYLNIVPGISGPEARRIVLVLRHFIQFLTLHSWGNPKRMESLFEHFTKPIESVDWRKTGDVKHITGTIDNVQIALQFGLMDQQRIILASHLYTQLYHDLGRQLASSGDKLVVSTMAAFQYILKFHRLPFSRYHLERMSETLSIYRSPELNANIDTLLTKVFHQQLRRIRNSHYRYRFNGDFEQEMRYISRVSDIESAAFNFSLDAAASIKAHYIDQLNDIAGKGPSHDKSDVAIYELCMILGDLFAQEQSHDEAFNYYQRAVDVFDKNSKKNRTRFAHFYVEALLRLGEIYERRHRYDQAASVYLHARTTVKSLKVDPEAECPEHLKNGDSKWDIFRQPFWAYWYLQLKQSPVPSSNKLPPTFEYPFHKIKDPINHYRAGQLAFFYGCHITSIGSFCEAIKYSGIETAQSERATYLGACAYLHLAENLFVGMMRYSWDTKAALNKKIQNPVDQVEKLRTAIIDSFSENDFDNKVINLAMLKDKFLEGPSDKPNSYLEKLQNIECDEKFLNEMDVCKTLGMMIHAAELLAERGLHSHASIAYLKIISIWGMLSEILFVLTEVGWYGGSKSPADEAKEREPLAVSDAARILKQSEDWIDEIRKRAEKSINFTTAGGYRRFLTRWKGRDLDSLFSSSKEIIPDGDTSPLFKWLKNEQVSFVQFLKKNQKGVFNSEFVIGHDLDEAIKVLFPKNDDRTNSSAQQRKDESRNLENLKNLTNEPIFLHRSMMGQKLIYLSAWEYMARARFLSQYKPWKIPHKAMVPHSTRNLIFAHWLAGRRQLYWSVLGKLTTVPSEAQRKEIYDTAAAAVHNLYRAFYYIRQLSGNDQDIMFPDPSMIFYDLWHLLYELIRWELGIPDKYGKKKEYKDVIVEVKEKLSDSKLRRDGTPANFYDFNNVTLRAIDALREVEQLGDISNRVRTDALRTRHFLADDYEDQRFHMDWTLVQMFGPAAGVLRHFVKLASEELTV